jgi:hypothetical protein
MSSSAEKTVRHSLGILLLLLTINAFGGGYYGMTGANDVPVEWLKGSPFKNYFVPGMVLFLLIGCHNSLINLETSKIWALNIFYFGYQ